MQCVPLLAPLVEAAGGKFVFLSSAMGSIADTRSSVGWLFRVSKAALHMAVRAASYDYPGSILVAMAPPNSRMASVTALSGSVSISRSVNTT